MPITPYEAYDGFSRSSNTTWGTSDVNNSWTVVAGSGATYSTNRGTGQIYVPARTNDHIIAMTGRPRQSEREVLMRFQLSSTTDASIGIVLNQNTTNNTHYRVHTYGGDLRLLAWVKGNNHSIAAIELGYVLSPNTNYWMRARYNASTDRILAKLWREGTAEPSSWMLNVAPNNTLLKMGTGVPGIFAQGRSVSYAFRVNAYYVYSLDPDYEGSLPVEDGFDRTRTFGWGASDSRHLWSGVVSSDPALRGPDHGSVASSFGTLGSSVNRATINAIGPSVRDSEINLRFAIMTEGGVVYMGLRGDQRFNSSAITEHKGYILRLQAGTNTFRIGKYPNFGENWVELPGGTLPFTLSHNAIYRARVQAQGSTIRTKVWRDSEAEPAGWQGTVTDTTLTTGRSVFGVLQEADKGSTFRLYDFTHGPVSSTDWATFRAIDSHATTETTASFRVTYTNDDNNNLGLSVQYRPDDGGTWRTTATIGAWQNFGSYKGRTVSISGLQPNTTYDVVVRLNDPEGVVGQETHTFTLTTKGNSIDVADPLEVTKSVTSSSITLTYGFDGDDNNNATSHVMLKKAGTTTWGNTTNAIRDGKLFNVTVNNLEPDTLYDIQITFHDPDGWRRNGVWGGSGTTTRQIQAQTIGKAVHMVSVSANPAETSALISVQYVDDINNNATFAIQYRSIKDRLYTTVNPATISIDRYNKTAYTTLPFLQPETSYEVEVTVSDPDGLAPNSPASLTTTFNTLGAVFDPDEKGKHFIYRIYSPEGEYLGTWPDAPDPVFTWNENGGVNDLTVTLPRRFASLNYERTIDFNNRVDVWALDGTSRGMGINLIEDANGDKGGWVLTTGWSVRDNEGADGTPCLRFSSTSATVRRIVSEPIHLERNVPITLSAVARATGGKLRMDIAAYDKHDNLIDVVDENAETVNFEWQRIMLEWLPPANTDYLRVRIENDGAGTMRIHKITMLVREQLVYRGEIDEYTVSIGPDGESVTIDILGYVSYLSDDYIDFLQFVAVQPQEDINAGRQALRKDPTDPANMLRQIIDIAREQNPRCPLYYTEESIKPTGVVAQYTFREKLLRDCFDKVVSLCPPSWHYYIEPDGCVWLRSSEDHGTVHKLRLNVEVSEYESERSIRRLKNVVRFKGRQDEDGSEPDGHGTIKHIAQDTESIAKYGRRVVQVSDAQVTDPITAEIIAEGRLEEYNVVEEAGRAVVPDEKDMKTHQGSLHGYNIQAIKPGDLVQIVDPETGPNHSFWDEMIWDQDMWDTKGHRMLTNAVPVKSIEFDGTQATLHLAHLPPTTRGDFARMLGIMRRNAQE